MNKWSDLLLAYYDENKRPLPWRMNPSPYQIWVSEVMLQQTRIETVKGYYVSFMDAFPTIKALAEADEDKVLKIWEGLGYYSRAKNLQKGARYVLEHFGGELPDSKEELLTIPGIGEYTSSAIASIAFGKPEIALDGNLFRVYSRLNLAYKNYDDKEARMEATSFFKKNISHDRPGDFNQALMELGETVCLPNGIPLCERCPFKDVCLAHLKGKETSLPLPKAKQERKRVSLNVFLILHEDMILIRKRPEKGPLSGTYEFPNYSSDVPIELVLNELNAEGPASFLGHGKHVFTHLEWEMDWYEAKADSMTDVEGCLWVNTSELKTVYMLPKAFTNFWAGLRSGSGRC